MGDQQGSWVGNVVGRAGLPAAVAIGLGVLSFAAGLLEPISRANRKLTLGVALVLAGLVWQAGSNWRFQHSDDRWWRSLVSVYFMALVGWTTALVVVVWVAFAPVFVRAGGGTKGTSIEELSADDLCEMWVRDRIQRTTDLWNRRLAVRVLCQGNEASARVRSGHWSGQGEIYVTVSPANGQAATTEAAAAEFKRQIETLLEAAINGLGWCKAYPKRTVQFLP